MKEKWSDMAKTKYVVELTEEERKYLDTIINDSGSSERNVMRARILLASDVNYSEKRSIRILAEELGTSEVTIKTVRNEFATLGLEKALFFKTRELKTYNSKVNEELSQKILALSKEAPPEGHKKWSLRLLCSEAEKRGIVDSISTSSIKRILESENK